MATLKELEDLLSEYQRLSLLDETKAIRKELNKIAERIGELNADLYVNQKAEELFNSKIKERVVIPRRGTRGVSILDLAYELENGDLLIVEAKFNLSLRGKVIEEVFAAEDISSKITRVEGKQKIEGEGVTKLSLREQVEQLDSPWVQGRIRELREKNFRLANKFNSALFAEKLHILEIRTIPDIVDGKLVVIVQVTDESKKISAYIKFGRPVITDQDRRVFRDVIKKEAFLEKIDLRDAKKNALLLGKEARKAEFKAKNAKKIAESAAKRVKKAKKPETIEKRKKIAIEKLEEANKLVQDAKTARKVATDANKDIKDIQKKLKTQTTARKKLSATKRSAELDKAIEKAEEAKRALHRTPSAVADKGIVNAAVADKSIKNAAIADKGVGKTAVHDVVRLEQALATEQKITTAVKVFTFTKNLGKFVITLLLPLTFLDLTFEIALWIYEWIQKRRSAEKEEWNRIITFLIGNSDPISVPFVGNYIPGIGNIIQDQINERVFDLNYTKNFLYWFDKWNTAQKWLGFVYPQVVVSLERQELIYEHPDTPNKIRYFLKDKPIISFNEISLFDNNHKSKKIEIPVILPLDGRNKFTGGKKNDPIKIYRSLQKEQENQWNKERFEEREKEKVRRKELSDIYAKLIQEYNKSNVEGAIIKVKYTIPSPVLTPFDFIIFKCKNLIVEILQFISKYDQYFIVHTSFDESTFWDIDWYKDIEFSYPINSNKAHWCIKTLYSIIKILSLHTTNNDDKESKGKDRRWRLVYEILLPRSNKGAINDIVSGLNGISQDLSEKHLAKPIDPDLEYLTNDYLCCSAMEIEKDLKRVYADIMTSNKARSYVYEYRGNFEE